MGMVFEDDVSGAWNEMFEAPGKPRGNYEQLFAELKHYEPDELVQRSEQLSHTFLDRGVTFAHSGEERTFPLDVLPRLLSSLEWDLISRGIAQRVKALEAFLGDVYGKGEIFKEGLMPRSVVTSSSHFCRVARSVEPPNGARITVAGIDLVRDEEGA